MRLSTRQGIGFLGLGPRSKDLSEDLGFYDGGPRGLKRDPVIRDSETVTETERAREREREWTVEVNIVY